MANTSSAEKRNRQAQKRRARNTSVRTQVRSAVKKVREGIVAKDPKKTVSSLKDAVKTISKAASKGVLHKRTAARRISRLSKAAHKSAN